MTFLSRIERAWMNGFVDDIIPESTSKPSSFIPGFEVKGSLFEVEIKEVQETAGCLVMQRMGRSTGGRAGRPKRERSDRIGDCWKALSRPDLCLGNREISLLSWLREEDGVCVNHPKNEMKRLHRELSI